MFLKGKGIEVFYFEEDLSIEKLYYIRLSKKCLFMDSKSSL